MNRRRPGSRRISGISSSLGHEAMEVLGLVAGNVGATIMQRQATTLNPKIVSGGQIVVGYFVKKHAKAPFMSGVGYGLMSAGAIGLTHEIGIIHGVEDFVSGLYGGQTYVETETEMPMRGISNHDTMSGISNGSMMSGSNNEFDYLKM